MSESARERPAALVELFAPLCSEIPSPAFQQKWASGEFRLNFNPAEVKCVLSTGGPTIFTQVRTIMKQVKDRSCKNLSSDSSRTPYRSQLSFHASTRKW